MKPKANAQDYKHIFPLLHEKPEVIKLKGVTIKAALERLAWLQAVNDGNQAKFFLELASKEPIEEFYSLHALVLSAKKENAQLEQQACKRKLIAKAAKHSKIRDYFDIAQRKRKNVVSLQFPHQEEPTVVAEEDVCYQLAESGLELAEQFAYDTVFPQESVSAVVATLLLSEDETAKESPAKKACK